MPKAKKAIREKLPKPGYLKLGESYTSLVLGIIVVIIGTVLLLSFAHTRNINRGENNKSNIPEGITEITHTNMETVIRSVRLSPTSTVTHAPKVSSPETDDKKKENEYIVKSGDTLWSIAQSNYKNGYNWVNIARANKLSNPDNIVVGQKVSLPKVDQKDLSGDILSDGVSTSRYLENSKISGSVYKIVEGDTLWSIAVRAYGDGYQWVKISSINKLSNPDLIFPGDSLQLPRI
jgi:nucleoid-associated protein YgaU